MVNDLVISGNKRVSDETIKIYGEVELNKNFNESDLNKVLSNLNSTNFFQNLIDIGSASIFNSKPLRSVSNFY